MAAHSTITATAADALTILPEESVISSTGELAIGGCRVSDLAAEYGTPAYILDEVGLRRQIRRFVDGLAAMRPNSEVLFASKSLPAVAMYSIAASEGLSIDVAGAGELVMAFSAGVPPDRIYLHGNAKSDSELQMAIDAGIRAIVIDNFDDLSRLERLVTGPQHVMLRMIPGIAPQTHASQSTGGNDSKFGLRPDQLEQAVHRIRSHRHLVLDGVHVHIGSQVLDTMPFDRAVRSVAELGTFDAYDVGGGLGVRYNSADAAPSVDEYLHTIVRAAEQLPATARLLIEPGRSIVARAGVTLYRVNTVKRTGKTFVAIDGGMADNLDIALTDQRYEAYVATKFDKAPNTLCDVVGRQCESGDLMVADAALANPEVGDLVVMPVTGAYAYTMANHYNGALTPPLIVCNQGSSRLAVRRETFDDVLATHQPAMDHSSKDGTRPWATSEIEPPASPKTEFTQKQTTSATDWVRE
ncbi:diaminopimelate decarboxylase [Spelaeicoccus albus]